MLTVLLYVCILVPIRLGLWSGCHPVLGLSSSGRFWESAMRTHFFLSPVGVRKATTAAAAFHAFSVKTRIISIAPDFRRFTPRDPAHLIRVTLCASMKAAVSSRARARRCNSSAIDSQTVAQLLATLGITKSHSRPHVSNDNPFSESQFKTLKYRPEFPERFVSYEHALKFCGKFFHWQNHEHHHWGLGLLTPAMVHHGRAPTVLAARQAVLTAAHAAHPERFVRQPPRPLALPSEVCINPPGDAPNPRALQLPRDTNFVPQLSQTP